jgi:nitrous oxide reductase accessory protein NosL
MVLISSKERRVKIRLLMAILVLLLVSCVDNSAKPTAKKNEKFQTVAIEKTTMLQSGKSKHSCPECGMKLPMFYKTNHSATSNGKVKQYCSIHCLADDKSIKKSSVKEIKVVTVDTLKFIPVEEVTYVVGSDIRGTMSGLSKYAFKGRMSARRFAKEHGGKIMNFKEAYEYALKDFKL